MRILLLKLDTTFVEPSCSYPTRKPAYSSSFFNTHAILDHYGFHVTRLELAYPLGSYLQLNSTDQIRLALRTSSLYTLLHKELNGLISDTDTLSQIDKLISGQDLICFYGGLFSILTHTTACFAITEVVSTLFKRPTLRIGNFANLADFFLKQHSGNVTIHNLIDTDPTTPVVNWAFSHVPAHSYNEQSQSSSSSSDLVSLLNNNAEGFQQRLINYHYQFFESSKKRYLASLPSIFSNPAFLKQRVLTIGGGCPQSCTFCPSRKTPNYTYPANILASIIQHLSSTIPSQRMLIDLLHADPLVDPNSYVALANSLANTPLTNNIISRIQTRIALLSNQDPNLFSAAATSLIYVGLETIDLQINKSVKKYNNSIDNFLLLAHDYKRHGIYLRANLILGLPNETEDYYSRLAEFISENPLHIGNICPFRPIPGTPDGDSLLMTLINSYTRNSSGTHFYPDWYSSNEVIYDEYCISFMSRYDLSPGSLSLRYSSHLIPTNKIESVYTAAHSLAQAGFDIIARNLGVLPSSCPSPS